MANMSNRGDVRTGEAREQAEAAKGHLQQAGQEARQAASTAASGLAQKAQDTASNLTERAKDVAHQAEGKADDALASMGQRLSSVAGSLRQSAPRQGAMGSAAGAVADRLESGGRYLQEHGVSDITDDVADTIRRHPLPALCLAFGVGFFIGMAASRR